MKNFEKYINDIFEAINLKTVNCSKCPARKMGACIRGVGFCLDNFKAWALKETEDKNE